MDFRHKAGRPAMALIILLAAGGPALAARPDTRAYTCDQGRAIVAQYGSIVMTTGQFTYDRIVHNRGFCGPGEETQLKVVPSLDNPRCRIGYTCRPATLFSR
ncbi:MAG: hypothetical protein BroJett030_01900 [Alphaproteobacteria bacterium]|nr:MAG: hypothetical protein BroJett030_01900 [Alphaproteobacteria bacterium]